MQTWMRFGIGVAAIALAIAAGTAAYAMRGENDEPPRQATNDAAPAPEDGADEDAAGGTFAAVCAPGYPDCEDMVVVGEPYGDFGESKCAPDVVNCVDPNSCVTTFPTEPGVVEPSVIEPTLVDPLPPEPSDPIDQPGQTVPGIPPDLSPEELAKLEEERARALEICVEPVPCLPGPADECLPPDCAISSDGAVSCPEPYPCVQMGIPEAAPDGAQDQPLEQPCPDPCTAPPLPEPQTQEDSGVATMPCVIEPCIDVPAVDPAASGEPEGETQPCPPAPEPCAVDAPDTVCILPAPADGDGSGSSDGSPGVVTDPAADSE